MRACVCVYAVAVGQEMATSSAVTVIFMAAAYISASWETSLHFALHCSYDFCRLAIDVRVAGCPVRGESNIDW